MTIFALFLVRKNTLRGHEASRRRARTNRGARCDEGGRADKSPGITFWTGAST